MCVLFTYSNIFLYSYPLGDITTRDAYEPELQLGNVFSVWPKHQPIHDVIVLHC